MRNRRVVASGCAAALLLSMLAACSPSSDPGGPSGPGSADPSTAGPSSLISTTCADLVPLADIRVALGDAVESDDFPFEPGGTWTLTQVGLKQGGALFCHWSDAANQAGEYPANLEITALPDAAAWAAWEAELAGWAPPTEFGEASFGTCSSSLRGSYHYCTHNVLVGGIWLYVAVQNLADPAAADPLIRAAVDSITAAEVSSATWAPAASGIALPADCEALLTTEQMAAATATADIAPREPSLNMPLINNAAFATGLSAGLDCSWSNPYSSAVPMPIGVTVLPGAGWAWESEWAKPRPARSPVVAVAGLGDAAFSGCTTDDTNECFVDVLADGAWLAVSGNKQAGEDALSALAQEALDSLGYAG